MHLRVARPELDEAVSTTSGNQCLGWMKSNGVHAHLVQFAPLLHELACKQQPYLVYNNHIAVAKQHTQL